MRILFTGVPAAGHLFPMVPVMRAARPDGDTVCVLTGGEGADVLPGWEVLERGPSIDEALALTSDRMGGDDGTTPGAGAVELFGGIRLELGLAAGAVEAARKFAPDLVVAEAFDQIGPYVASVLDVPLVVHALTGPVPPELMNAIVERADAVFAENGVHRTARSALIDPFPDVLLEDPERRETADRLAVRPAVHTEDDDAPRLPPRTPGRARVLVSLGTAVDDIDALRHLVEGVLGAGADAVVTLPRGVPLTEQAREHVTWVGFSPLSGLLPEVDAVVSAGGTGTTLAALAAGLPLAIRPFLADQPWNAERLARHGVATVIDDDRDAARAIDLVLTDPTYRSRAEAVKAAIDRLPTALDVLRTLRVRLDIAAA